MMLKRLLLALCGLFFIELTALADEGMWLLPLLKQYNFKEMQRLGFAQNDSYIYNEGGPSLKDAVVRFGRGCTGEFISYKGLILTNHHCGYNAIQQHSSVEHDYLRDGFWAHNQADEIPTPGLTVTVLVRMEDVTSTMLKDIPDSLSLLARSSILRPRGDSLLQAASEGTHYVVEIKPFYEHNKYYLMVYEVFKDVRLVGAPPSAIGKFGGETDNWMYPRHTGDFSLFRVYANQNNEPADYSPDNIPYKPKKALTVSLSGINEGDFAMILGNPGSTNRYMTSWEVKQVIEVRNRARADVRGVKQAV
ncbi:MAG: S46 family peptidase, partial [Bacteroides sp.]